MIKHGDKEWLILHGLHWEKNMMRYSMMRVDKSKPVVKNINLIEKIMHK